MAAAAYAAVWLFADVQLSYAGHLTGLFYTGSTAALPPGPIADHTYRVQDPRGYDGAFYHLIAHDPLNRRGFLAYVDTPQYRWRRIGIPGLAHLLAFGRDEYVDRAYVALQLLAVFLGAFWLSSWAAFIHRRTTWGLAFLVIPATAVSLDRMTIDLPLAALTSRLLLDTHYNRRPRWSANVALAAAPLIRETGLILVLAWCVFFVLKRDWLPALAGAMCAIPTFAWWLYVAQHTIPDRIAYLSNYPFSGLLTWTAHALTAPAAVYGPRAGAALELLALGGIWVAFVLAAWLVARRRWTLAELIAILFALFASWIGYQEVWASAYGIGRTLSPLLIAMAWIALRDRRPVFALPLLMIVPRIALQFAAEIKVALRAGL